jgi:hypothetical protein
MCFDSDTRELLRGRPRALPRAVHDSRRSYFRSMRLAISIPQLDAGTFETNGVKSYLARAEQLGFEAGWVMEQSIAPPRSSLRWSYWRTRQPAPSGSGSGLPL